MMGIRFVGILVSSLLMACSPGFASDNQQSSKPEIDRPVPDPEPQPVEETLVLPPAEGTLYATWINVWNSSSTLFFDEHDIFGMQCEYPDGSWKAMDWNNPDYRKITYRNLQQAGIDVIVTDNTNYKLEATDLLVQDIDAGFCPLRFCVAFGNGEELENDKARAWLGKQSKHPSYFRVEGKPLVICYGYQDAWFNKYQDAADDPFLQGFYRVMACRDSFADKWGWQLRPEDGSVASPQAMFVTPSVKHLKEGNGYWWRSLAMLDYTFWQSRQSAPKHVVVGSYDDYAERNCWMPLKTRDAVDKGKDKFKPVSQVQNFDPWTGDIAEPDLFYDRVTSWISGTALKVVPGGLVDDGIWKIKNLQNLRWLQAEKEIKQSALKLGLSYATTYDKFVLYHLGENRYRLVNVFAGRPARLEAGKLVTDHWTTGPEGYFTLSLLTPAQMGDIPKEACWELFPVGTFSRNEVPVQVTIADAEGHLLLGNQKGDEVAVSMMTLPSYQDGGEF